MLTYSLRQNYSKFLNVKVVKTLCNKLIIWFFKIFALETENFLLKMSITAGYLVNRREFSNQKYSTYCGTKLLYVKWMERYQKACGDMPSTRRSSFMRLCFSSDSLEATITGNGMNVIKMSRTTGMMSHTVSRRVTSPGGQRVASTAGYVKLVALRVSCAQICGEERSLLWI